MPTFKTGNIFDHLTDYDGVFFTSCGVIKCRDSGLVMGRGFAAEVYNSHPRLSPAIGQMIMKLGEKTRNLYGRRYKSEWIYGIIPPQCYFSPDEGGWLGAHSEARRFGAFQTKLHFADASYVDLVEHSVKKLRRWALKRPRETYALNYPGIGLGQLTRAAVEPCLTPLPHNIHVFSLDCDNDTQEPPPT